MFKKSYTHFVKANSPEQCPADCEKSIQLVLSGDEARRLYLEEVKDARSTPRISAIQHNTVETRRPQKDDLPLKDTDLYLIVQNNDVDILKRVLDKYPDKINIVDDYGWSLLMIACQANSVETAQELLKRGIDISVRDKAGNSARSLVIKNKNHLLVDVLLQYRNIEIRPHLKPDKSKKEIHKEYTCDVCNRIFPDREEHLSSTLHNISASKGKKIPANYVIPSSNRGYQLMLKGGWDKDSGLGRDGSGRKYPIKPVQKKDRKGLGKEKRKPENKPTTDNVNYKNRKMIKDDYKRSRQLEINFRREFY